MKITRRTFLNTLLVASASTVASASDDKHNVEKVSDDHVGCLIDTTVCIGCRKCEQACNIKNHLPVPEEPFTDRSVFSDVRRPTEKAFTVINGYENSSSFEKEEKDTFVKIQCMHCLHPSCVSACIVGALQKTEDGPVVYNPDICMGCRYCMVACPFEIPAYEYFNPVTPKVRKCEFCYDKAKNKSSLPACAAACPTEALLFGKRSELLKLAKARISKSPMRYNDHIYGEFEVGGTGYMYLSAKKTEQIGLRPLPAKSPAETTEAIQHGIFKYGIIPFSVYGLLGSVMYMNNRKEKVKKEEKDGGES